jgi:predicted flap endonuclease-1-like 5' DNA nuclease
MESKKKLNPIVNSPARDAHQRKGNGFSLLEIKTAGYSIDTIKSFNIKIDYNRRSIYEKNVELLKTIEVPKTKGKKREPFVAKQKTRTPFKPKSKKPIKKAVKEVKKPVKTKLEVKSKEIKPKKSKIIEKAIASDMTPLNELSGLGPATEKKFNELGVDCVEALLSENPEELAPLIKGCSEERIRKWIEEGKDLVK